MFDPRPVLDLAVPLIRVLLVDDHHVVRLGLQAMLATEPDIEVVGEAANGEAAVQSVARLAPDVVVMDVSMVGLGGEAATRRIMQLEGARPAVLALTMHGEAECLLPMLDAGAAGYLHKSAASRDLARAVRTVAGGGTYVRPEAAQVLAHGWRRRAERGELRAQWDTLSTREQDVLRLLAEGYTLVQIGERLFISRKTVDTYRRRITEKLSLADRADYVRFALDLGLLAATTGAGADDAEVLDWAARRKCG